LGVDDSVVRSVDADGLGAWVSDTVASIVASPGRARSHDRVIRVALEHETPLPARFGQIVADDATLRAALTGRGSALRAALERVDGAVEMTVRVLIPPDPVVAVERGAPSSSERRGRHYLEEVAARERAERNVLAKVTVVRDRVSAAVGALVRAESFGGAAPGSALATLSHLVPREHIDAYRSALQTLRAEDPALAIMVSGPWAPYSFAEGVHA
jgi:hypothetical protein